jgi:hypothetical protein
MPLAARGILIYKGSMKSKQAAPPLAGQKTPAESSRRAVHQPPASEILVLPKNGERARETEKETKKEEGKESDRGSE